MGKFKEILVVLNSFEDAKTVLKKAFIFAKEFKARVSVIYVHETPFFSIEEIFKDRGEINKDKIKEHAKRLLKEYSSDDIAVIVKIDDTADRVWDIVRDSLDTLVISKYNEKISNSLIEKLKQPLLFIKSDNLEYKKAAIVVENLRDAEDAISECKEFTIEDFELLYNFYYIPDTAALDPALSIGIDSNLEILDREEELFNKFKEENNIKGELFVNSNLGEENLFNYINKKGFDFLCYKEQGDELLFANETVSDLANELKCDILIEKAIAI